MFTTICFTDNSVPNLEIGDRVFVKGTLATGKGVVVAKCYPNNDQLPSHLPVHFDKPFPQVTVALDELNDKCKPRLITYDGNDLAAGKVLHIYDSFRIADYVFNVPALRNHSKFADVVATALGTMKLN